MSSRAWEFQEGFETEAEYLLFKRWRAMGADHAAQRRLAKWEGMSFLELDHVRKAGLWNDRWAVLRATIACELDPRNETETKRHVERMKKLRAGVDAGIDLVGVELGDAASAALRTGRGGTMRPAEAVKALSTLAQTAEALAPPPEALDGGGSGGFDLGKLTVEEQLTYRALAAKGRTG